MTSTLDADTQAMSDALNEALATSGLTQAEFSAALGTSASRFSTYRSGKTAPSAPFFLRALRIAASLHQAREHGWMTPLQTRTAIRQALDEGDEQWAFRLSIQARDHLHEMLAESTPAADAWEAAPGSTGKDNWDILLAAIIEHEFAEHDRPAPHWTAPRRLDEHWLLPNPFFTEDEIRAQTPDWLSERGIFIAARDLTTA